MVQSYDDWVTHGTWSKCECGASYCQADCGPCHERCKRCDALTDVDELDDDKLCDTCAANPPCEGCGEDFPVALLVEGLCPACRKEDEPQ